ncbi:hypothetical protein ACFFJ7_05365 [Pseudochelatococcus lubricantis]|uniref:hypothetical protein n=1 Tax=Pseudochelatococcus lubricantis TaxID=1538102 RepID=UPI0035EB00A0
MAIIITPASTRALTTPDEVARQLGIKADADNAPRLIELILAASAAIEGTLRRTLTLQQYEEHVYVAASRPAVLSHTPVRTITIDGIAGLLGREVDVGTGLLSLPAGTHVVTYWAGHDLPGSDPRPDGAPPADPMRFHLPVAITRAATLLAASYWHSSARDPWVKSETVDGVGSQSFGNIGSAVEVDALLAPHRDVPVA